MTTCATDDFVGGNASFGRIRGLEAQTLFLMTAQRIGLPPEDHLSCMTQGNDLAFRARVWGRARHAAPWVDMIGHLIFDPRRGKFCFYYGFYDAPTMNGMLASLTPDALEQAAIGGRAVMEATQRYEASNGPSPPLPERLRVSDVG